MKERFHMGIVGHVPRSVHTLDGSELCQAVAKRIGRLLNAPIGVKDSSRLRLALRDGTIECPQGQLHVLVPPETPAHDLSRVLVHKRG
jgi:hypothetical protein